MKHCVYDFIAIGLGPFNLGLACLAQPIPSLKCLFLERKSQFSWHPGMFVADSMIQTPFLNDLVTMAAPTSKFSFLNYLKENGRLYPFCITDKNYVSRLEYNDYCNWAADLLDNIYFMQDVKLIEYDEKLKLYCVSVADLQSGKITTYQARRIVIVIGTKAYQPCSTTDTDENICHTAQNNFAKKTLVNSRVITIIGSGQSATEVFYNLLCEDDFSQRDLN